MCCLPRIAQCSLAKERTVFSEHTLYGDDFASMHCLILVLVELFPLVESPRFTGSHLGFL